MWAPFTEKEILGYTRAKMKCGQAYTFALHPFGIPRDFYLGLVSANLSHMV